ncbi:hypothetical protein [Streptomyces chartreusis]|uniref:hypothetical protein n=1 Tax=Streptomyces chartreusis TaxID=1969 RepID=UPI00386C6C38|nr:hypothetical protein OG938_47485 [Streptomyces chartreusis]WTA33681.1 hypothetical protein OIA45_48065 [Streptomyces chartreusis]
MYAPDPEDRHPNVFAQAELCAEAIAVHLGLIPFCGSCAALHRYGISHRVGAGSVEGGWLVTTGHAGAVVYITAHHPKYSLGYDVPADGLLGDYAVITQGPGTRLVYAPDPEDRHPNVFAQAELCAEAIAVHLGLIPFGGSCEDTGSVILDDDSHDGQVGSQGCEWGPCVERRVAAARRAQQHMSSFVADDGTTGYGVQICASCHFGGFTPVPGEYVGGHPVYACTAVTCDYTVAHADLIHGLTHGQSLTVLDGRLYIAEPCTGPALPPF